MSARVAGLVIAGGFAILSAAVLQGLAMRQRTAVQQQVQAQEQAVVQEPVQVPAEAPLPSPAPAFTVGDGFALFAPAVTGTYGLAAFAVNVTESQRLQQTSIAYGEEAFGDADRTREMNAVFNTVESGISDAFNKLEQTAGIDRTTDGGKVAGALLDAVEELPQAVFNVAQVTTNAGASHVSRVAIAAQDDNKIDAAVGVLGNVAMTHLSVAGDVIVNGIGGGIVETFVVDPEQRREAERVLNGLDPQNWAVKPAIDAAAGQINTIATAVQSKDSVAAGVNTVFAAPAIVGDFFVNGIGGGIVDVFVTDPAQKAEAERVLQQMDPTNWLINPLTAAIAADIAKREAEEARRRAEHQRELAARQAAYKKAQEAAAKKAEEERRKREALAKARGVSASQVRTRRR